MIGTLPPIDQLKVSDVGAFANHRDPILRMFVAFDVPNTPRDSNLDHVHVFGFGAADPQTQSPLPADVEKRLNLGTGFFFPLQPARFPLRAYSQANASSA